MKEPTLDDISKDTILRLGILMFSFCMLCFDIRGDMTVWKLGYTVSFPAPVPLYQGVAWFSLALATLLVVAAFCKRVRNNLRLKEILADTEPAETPIAVAWKSLSLIVWVDFICGWTGFLSKITPQSVAFDVVFWFGLILFVLCTYSLGQHIFPRKQQGDGKGG